MPPMNADADLCAPQIPAEEAESATGSLTWRLWAMLAAFPALCMAAVGFFYGVNVPYYDEWTGTAPLFEAMADGRLGAGDFFAQHNEHRIVVPRLFFFVLGWLTHGNIRAEMALTWVTIVALSAMLWLILKATGWRVRDGARGLYFVTAVFCFTVLQEQNLLNGFQFAFVLPLPLFAASVWAAIALPRPRAFGTTLLLNTACTFSLASGFFSWVLTFPLLLLRRDRSAGQGLRQWWLIWGIAFVVNVLGYFHGYQSPPRSPQPLPAISQPGLHAEYFLTYLGTPFATGTALNGRDVAPLVGACLLALFAGAAFQVWRSRRDKTLLGRALPWLMIAAFSLANVALTTLGRASFGVQQAMESRYVAYAILLPISLLPLGALLIQRLPAKTASRSTASSLFAGLTAAFLLLHTLASLNCVAGWPAAKQVRRLHKAIVQTVNCVDQPKLINLVTPSVATFRETANTLNRLGYLHPPLLRSPAIASAGDPRDEGHAGFGEIRPAPPSADGEMIVEGWAILPERLEPADAVLLTCDTPEGMPLIFALVPITGRRPDIVATTGEPGYVTSGWQWIVYASRLPPHAGAIKAWAYDAGEARAYRLAGAVEWPRSAAR